jgi:hypothetical protein
MVIEKQTDLLDLNDEATVNKEKDDEALLVAAVVIFSSKWKRMCT